MPRTLEGITQSPEVLVVSLARTGERSAFAELVRRRQAWLRNLMWRLSGDQQLADDLAQQAFLQAWRNIRRLRDAKKFPGWIKSIAVNTWRQHLRKHDALRHAEEHEDHQSTHRDATGLGMDLDDALSTLSSTVRMCIVLAYQEGLSHNEIAKMTDIPLGTVKSHISRGTQKLKQHLSDYQGSNNAEESA